MVQQSQRRENRVKVAWEAKVGLKGVGVGRAFVRNISLSGVYFETQLTLAMQSRILLESYIEHAGDTRRLFVECEIIRCASAEQLESKGYGARFIKLGKDNLSLLLPVLAELWITQGKGQTNAAQGLSQTETDSLLRKI